MGQNVTNFNAEGSIVSGNAYVEATLPDNDVVLNFPAGPLLHLSRRNRTITWKAVAPTYSC